MSRPVIPWLVIAIFGMHNTAEICSLQCWGRWPGPELPVQATDPTLLPVQSSYAGVLFQVGLLPTSQSKTFATSPARSPAKSILSCPSPVPFPSLPSPPSLSHCCHRLASKAELTCCGKVLTVIIAGSSPAYSPEIDSPCTLFSLLSPIVSAQLSGEC